MARRSTPTTRKRIGATSAARTPTERSSIVHSSLYLPEPVYEALRKIAFDERVKIHDLVLEGLKGEGGTVMKTSLDHTKEAALQAALAGVQAAVPASASESSLSKPA